MSGTDLIFLGLLIGMLLPMALVDLREQRIPNSLNLGIAAVGLAHALLRQPGFGTAVGTTLQALAAFVIFAATTWIMQRINRHAKIGWGDLKFLVAMSFWVGLDGCVAVLLLACFIHILAILVAIPWAGFRRDQLRPFGPMLAVGAVAVVIASFLQYRPAS
jgi:leader peptidase (prepilin peptidase)/N-methyltransferase